MSGFRTVPFTKPFLFTALCAATLSACSEPAEVRRFEMRVDDDYYTVTDRKPVFAFLGAQNGHRTVRVNGEDVPCPVMPCTGAIREAGNTNHIDEFRRAPAGADLTTE
ncbi:hypothetical protein [Roseovarius indicus]|uniref:Lipoprotein n=1 Tax=Roseovarius indicus TaxID=540747 RepID=A0A5P3AC50_9RHOB|nr:hypothetical protein [Roseovarius indicus]OAN99150.1 hypothetical protein A8B76_16205 [Roseovarius indicus]QEW26160.1 hypothetical protein RIdsm_01956 [Roseovarius indicus]SFD94232.1 hypothetical protein SAMN04488031_103369 [Roseovarius indicus]